MVIFGLVLLLLAVLVVIAAVAHGGAPASLDLQLFTVKTNVLGTFVAGAVTLLVAVLGAALVVQGIRHDRARRAQIKDLKKRAAGREGKPAASSPPPKASSRPPTRTITDESSSRSTTPTSSGGSTSADVRRDDGPDAHFESAPRDPAS